MSNPDLASRVVAFTALALLAGCSHSNRSSGASEQTVDAHTSRAQQAAGEDLKGLLVLCKPAPPVPPSSAEVDRVVATQLARAAPAPGQAFDNLYFLGDAWVSAWALTTSEGIILFDALNNDEEASTLVVGGLRRLGLDPGAIRTIVVTHAHGDHYGGVTYLVDRYHPRVAMSDSDWTMAETKLELESSRWGPVPRRDVGVHDGDVVTLGDTQVTLYETPGHTGGTLSPVFDVYSHGQRHRAMLWGGTAFNFGRDVRRLDSYIQSAARMMGVAQAQRIDVFLSNHPGYDGTVSKLDALRQAQPPDTNPFVLGTSGVERALTVMSECAQATRERFASQKPENHL